uniref:Alpha-amylase n=1 Tax=Acidobacterium capsulatum TaxID=33075 RepID=A0A7V5CTG8_9BACT
MSYFVRTVSLAVLSAGLCLAAQAQLQTQKACEATPANATPCVYRVDPPNWWTKMPAPMLLLYGRNLKDTHITVQGRDISITRTHFSANGHYAFVWLADQNSAPQTLQLKVSSAQGETSFPFVLGKRKPASDGFQGFSAADTMYLIMTDRFADGDLSNDPHPSQLALPRGWHGGDFKGIQDHLNYLKQLGITTIWITPAYDNSGGQQDYHGYSATDMYKPDPHFGSIEDFENLVSAVHADGMKFVLDTVPNHVGAANPWAIDPPAPGWFHGTVAHHDAAKSNFEAITDPHSDWAQRKDITEGWFANVLPDLNQENPLVSQYLTQNALWWIETGGLDGLRIDTFPYVGRAFWQHFNGEIHQVFPRVTEVGEVFNPDPTIVSYFAGGVAHDGIDTHLYTPFDFPTYFALRAVLTHQKPMSYLESVWGKDWLYPHPNRLVPFFGNHDTMRFMSLPGMTVADLKLAYGIVLTMRGMPEIYYGDELAMKGGDDPNNRHDFPGGFPGDKRDAFKRTGRTSVENDVHDWVAGLLHFRDAHSVFGNGGQQDIEYDSTSFVYLRARDISHGCTPASHDRVLVAINDGAKTKVISIVPKNTALAGCTTFMPAAGTNVPALLRGGNLKLTLAPKQMAIYTVH